MPQRCISQGTKDITPIENCVAVNLFCCRFEQLYVPFQDLGTFKFKIFSICSLQFSLFKYTSLGKPVKVNIVFEILAFGEVDEANMVRTEWKHERNMKSVFAKKGVN